MITLLGKAELRASRCLWTLEELGVDYTHNPVDYRTGAVKTGDFLAINPGAKIPALTDDTGGGDVAMFESMAMNLYLAQTYGTKSKGGSLWPDDTAGQAQCLQWTLFAGTELEPNAVGRLIEFIFKEKPDESVLSQLAEKTGKALDVLEATLSKSTFLAGEAFTVADLNVAGVADYLVRTSFDLSKWPKTEAWLKVCFERPAFIRVNEIKAAERAAAA